MCARARVARGLACVGVRVAATGDVEGAGHPSLLSLSSLSSLLSLSPVLLHVVTWKVRVMRFHLHVQARVSACGDVCAGRCASM